ncbi:MAG: efflux RND transporter periplasmic adaptor subunit [Nitrospirae bacterium]|nr:MAG: efflux RND transporter periplasmic adaptor subunit [Nitrospirota bacterium]
MIPPSSSAMHNGQVARRGWIALVATLLLVGCGDQGGEPKTVSPNAAKPGHSGPHLIQAPPSIHGQIRTEAAAIRPIPEMVTAPGEVALDLKQVAKVTSRIEGQVEQVHVQLGDRVRSGQPLVAIGGPRLDELVQEYLVSKAQADVAENSFQRTQKLWAEQIVTERRLVEERGHFLETKARYQHAREKLLNMGMAAGELQQLERDHHVEGHRYTIKSPIAGTVVAQHIVLGQGVSSGIELFEIVDTSRVWIFASLAIEQARRFTVGDTAMIVPKGAEPITAPLTYISPLADEKTRTVRVRFEVANQDGRLKPQEYVEVRLAVPAAPTLAVPAAAVTLLDQTRGVFVQREAGYLFTPVEVGREGEGWVEIRSGLTAGDRVVTDGVFDLKNVLLKDRIQSGEGG